MKKRNWGWVALIASEVFSAVIGFFVLMRLARTLGPSSFSSVEYATAIAGVMLVWVRGGVETITHREAARRPRLIAPLSEALLVAKLGLAFAGLSLIVAFGLATHSVPFAVLVTAGMILLPSALCLDVGPRARCDLFVIAVIQGLRSIGLGLSALVLVSGSHDSTLAAGCLVLAETVATLGFGFVHFRRFGMPRIRLRVQAVRVLIARGAITSLGRFARVFLYAADLLILGTMIGSTNLGSFATARRVVFAILGVGLVIPAAIGPLLAKVWASRPSDARSFFANVTSTILGPTLAASLGLALTAHGWMKLLFGSSAGANALELSALRLPLMMMASMVVVALIACRREVDSLKILLIACLLAIVGISLAAISGSPMSAAWWMLAVELFIVAAGWYSLWKIGSAPRFPTIEIADVVAIACMCGLVSNLQGRPVWAVSLAGAATYGLVRFGSKSLTIVSLPRRMEAAR